MIQRIQTLYLFLVVVLGIVLCFMPVVQLDTPVDAALQRSFQLSALGLEETSLNVAPELLPTATLNGTWGLLLTTILIPLLALVDIFLYKKRILQARLNIFLCALCLGYYAILALFIWFAKMNLSTEWSLLGWASIPLVCFVLTLMATRAILKDEALVRAADRIR